MQSLCGCWHGTRTRLHLLWPELKSKKIYIYLFIYIYIFVYLSTYLFIYLQSDARPGAAGGGDEAHWPDQLWPDARSGQVKREVIFLLFVKYILDEWVLKHSTTFICLIVQSSGVVSEWEIFRFDWRWCMGSGWHPSNSQTSQPLQSYQPHTHTGDTRLLRNWGFSSLKPGQLFKTWQTFMEIWRVFMHGLSKESYWRLWVMGM